MTNYEYLKDIEPKEYSMNIQDINTLQFGSACLNGIEEVNIFIGNPSGCDDKIISLEEFNSDYIIVDIIDEYGNIVLEKNEPIFDINKTYNYHVFLQ